MGAGEDRQSIELMKKAASSDASADDLRNLIEHQDGLPKEHIVERIYKKKGVLHFITLKVPAKIFNIGSIYDSQKFLNDSVRSLSSTICPSCGDGMLMYNLKKMPNDDGDVLWFCSNQQKCDYQVYAKPSFSGVLNEDLQQKINVNHDSKWKEQWLALTKNEKDVLIGEHLEKAEIYLKLALTIFFLFLFFFSYINFGAISFLLTIPFTIFAVFLIKWLYRKEEISDIYLLKYGCIFVGALIVLSLIIKFWLGTFNVIMLVSFVVLLSLKWCYRAWQIKTGQTGFLDWLKGAESYYSVSWVDNQTGE